MALSTKINPVSADLDLDQYIDGMLSSFAWNADAFIKSPLGTQALSVKIQQLPIVFQISCSTTKANTSDEPRSNFAALNPEQQSAIEYMLQQFDWSSTGVSQKFPTVT